MGNGLASNLAEKGFQIAAWDIDLITRREQTNLGHHSVQVYESLVDLIAALEPPRCIWLSIPGGDPVDQMLTELQPSLFPGDIIVDCGNTHFEATRRREADLQISGIAYLGVGVSGGPDGARLGPSIMAGGNRQGWEKNYDVFAAIAAKAGTKPCCEYFGVGGSGHFVKMAHNGIEYGIMHLLMETYAILGNALNLHPDSIAETFRRLNSDLTESFLTAITAVVSSSRLNDGEQYMIDRIDGAADQKGTGLWAVQTAIELGVAVPTLAEAVMYRQLSFVRKTGTHVHADDFPHNDAVTFEEFETLEGDLQKALSLAFLSAFAQGLSLLAAAKPLLGHDLDLSAVLRTWRRGCILQGELVNRMSSIPQGPNEASNILNVEGMTEIVTDGIAALRQLVARAALAGIPCSGLASALAYVEAKRGNTLPTGLLQLQRNYFGRHPLRDKETGLTMDGPWHGTEKDS